MNYYKKFVSHIIKHKLFPIEAIMLPINVKGKKIDDEELLEGTKIMLEYNGDIAYCAEQTQAIYRYSEQSDEPMYVTDQDLLKEIMEKFGLSHPPQIIEIPRAVVRDYITPTPDKGKGKETMSA